MTFEEKLIQLRKARGLSQEALAEQLRVSRQAVSRWELGETTPDLTNLKQLSALYGVSADYLLHDEYASDEDLPKVKETAQAFKEKEINRRTLFTVIALIWLLSGFLFLFAEAYSGNGLMLTCSGLHFFNAALNFFIAYRSKR